MVILSEEAVMVALKEVAGRSQQETAQGRGLPAPQSARKGRALVVSPLLCLKASLSCALSLF